MPGFKEYLKDKLSQEELKLVKRSQDIIGDIAIIEVPEELEGKKSIIAEALLEAKPYIRTVLRKGKHTGEFRTQELEWLAGEKKKEALYKESGCRLKLNVEEVYFTPRLSNERERIADKVKKGEKVLVMFSGCAPYPCVIAKKADPERIVGVEINPTAHKYGLQNARLNKLENVELYLGDVGEIVPELKERFDRVLMPAPHNAREYLGTAISALKPNGFLHYYDFSDEESIEEKEVSVEKAAEKLGRKAARLETVKCGQVSPGNYRICIDLQVD